jgi:hypothetical protein
MTERYGTGMLRPPGGGGADRDRFPPGTWLRRRLGEFGGWLFRSEDALARQHGWLVERGRLGLSRTYRDERFGPPEGTASISEGGEHVLPATSTCP